VSQDALFPRCPRLFRGCVNLLTDLDEVEFQTRFRMTKECFADLLTALERGTRAFV